MKYPAADWIERRKAGLVRYVLVDGIIKTGGPFAVVMQVVGYFVLRDDGQSFTEYFMLSRTWLIFFLDATLFGLVMGLLNWFTNEKVFKATTTTAPIDDDGET